MALPLLLLFATGNSDGPESISRPKGTSATLGCANHLVTEIDRKSFAAAGVEPGSGELDRWEADSARAFRQAAAKLCAAGTIERGDLARLKRLVVQYGGGADSAAVWRDEAMPDAIILQYAFSPGAPAPSAEEAREALICWKQPDTAVCAERLP